MHKKVGLKNYGLPSLQKTLKNIFRQKNFVHIKSQNVFRFILLMKSNVVAEGEKIV